MTYVEAAKKFAERIMGRGKDPGESIAWAFRLATQRAPAREELGILVKGYSRRLLRYRAEPKSAAALLSRGETKVSGDYDPAELASMTTVASVLLNLDEVINK